MALHRKLLKEALRAGLAKLRAEEEATTAPAAMPTYGSQVRAAGARCGAVRLWAAPCTTPY